jgi:hypothetical protein
MTETSLPLPPERIERAILLLRGHKVLLDADLAALYGVATRVLVQAVHRNRTRFPDDFMFQLSDEEFARLRSQGEISNPGRGGRYRRSIRTDCRMRPIRRFVALLISYWNK